jgi:hypothetical protein
MTVRLEERLLGQLGFQSVPIFYVQLESSLKLCQ